MSIGMLLISVELVIMLFILLFVPGNLAGPCFIGFAIGESLGAAALRVAGGIFTKIADIGIGPDEDRVQDQGRRRAQPGRHRRLHGRQRRRFGGPLGRRLRNLRRHRRRADHLHPAGGHQTAGSGAVAGLDLLHARHDGDRLGGRLLRQRRHRQGPLRQRRQDELRDAADHAGVADLAALDRPDLRPQFADDPGPRRRHLPVVETLHGDQLRHAGRSTDSRVREGLHLHQLAARPRDRHQFPRGWRVAEYPVRPGGRELQRLLARLSRSCS